jgi:hypothetical protein
MGEWENSVESNVKAWNVSVERAKRKNLDADAQSYHAHYWLMYSYLQLGQYEEALAKLNMMAEFAEETKTSRSTWHYAAMRAAYVVETRAKDLPKSIDADSLRLSGAAKQLFADGYGALNAGDLEGARLALATLQAKIEESSPGSLDKQVERSSCSMRRQPSSRSALSNTDHLRSSNRRMSSMEKCLLHWIVPTMQERNSSSVSSARPGAVCR